MNLIEQLGGYEKAKAYVEYVKVFGISDVENALLEYRRQNNIFEECDKVVAFFNNEVLFVDEIDGDFIVAIFGKSTRSVKAHKSAFRHATDEEIAASWSNNFIKGDKK